VSASTKTTCEVHMDNAKMLTGHAIQELEEAIAGGYPVSERLQRCAREFRRLLEEQES